MTRPLFGELISTLEEILRENSDKVSDAFGAFAALDVPCHVTPEESATITEIGI